MPSRRPRPLSRLLVGLLASATALAALADVAPATAHARTTAPPSQGSAPPAAEQWQVADLGGGRYRVTWTASRALPMRSDRPTITGAGLRFGPSSTTGRRVSAVVTAAQAPDPADLDVVLSGERLDEPGTDRAVGRRDALTPASPTTLLPVSDPALPGPFSTVSSDYELPRLRVPDLRRAVEVVGHVVEPAPDQVTGPRPLVLLMHGRHEVCYDPGDPDAYTETWPCRAPFEEVPSHLGYTYLQQLLASHGYATVSVRVNGVNAQDGWLDDGGADARAMLVEHHLDHWTTLAAAHQVDLDRVVLVGHSRGGEGVDRAATEIPLSAPYRIAGQVLLAPVDFASHAAPYVPTVTLLPYCDGDVSDLQGQRYTDSGRDVVDDDTSLKSSVLVLGANHNFFNTEWTPGQSAAPSRDDWIRAEDQVCGSAHPGRLSPERQQDVARAYVAGAVRLFLGDDDYLPLFDGSHAGLASTADVDVRSHALGGGRDVRRPGIEATPTAPDGRADSRLCTGIASFEGDVFDHCGRRMLLGTPHWNTDGAGHPTRRFLELAWTRPGAVAGLRFDDPLDLTADRLELRTIVDPRWGAVDLRVRLTDGSGQSVVLEPEGGRVVEPLLRGDGVTKLWAQALLVDASATSGLDRADVRAVELLGGGERGRVWVADLAAAPARLAPVPAVRLPLLSLGTVELVEGDTDRGAPAREARRVARIPFTVTGTVTRPGRFAVEVVGQQLGAVHRFTVEVAPGQTRGTIPVAYTADRVADYQSSTVLAAWATRGLATDRYVARLEVRDDDPVPVPTIRVPRTVREGRPVVVTMDLDVAAGYDLYGYLQVVRGPGRDLRGTDVPATLLEPLGSEVDPRMPLWQLGVYLPADLAAGRKRGRLVLPTLADGVREGAETLTLRVNLGETTVRRTVRIVDVR